ncbi:MAG: glutamine--fructose-6-phosphate transaminase (isomerizing) [Proteobacteria bacterium]|nr:glutamine--fructose-6-phosphate transaminase (isomerizing) [Pseudomonadota bacterium]
MCGIVGYTGSKKASPIIIEGLRRLEYRGYDSAGIATQEKEGIKIIRSVGKLNNLIEKLSQTTLLGNTGIGHTRWATHGKPSEVNAHPHKAGKFVVVHNGIIENYLSIKNKLVKRGCNFESETDTEVIAHLLWSYYEKSQNTKEAILKTVKELRGSFAIAILNEDEKESIYLVRYESPLVIGVGENENYFASDIPALLVHTNNIIFLKDGDIIKLTPEGYEAFDFNGKKIIRLPEKINLSLSQAEKGGYPHFMLKEIHEQPEAFINTVRTRIKPDTKEVVFDEIPRDIFKKVESIHIIACGTSYHAGLIGRFFLEEIAGLPTLVEIASEFRYKKNFFNSKTLYIFISQSGSTADTLAALKLTKNNKVSTLAICNVLGSSISTEADYTIYTHAGPEIGVASTKAFSTQIAVLFLLSLQFGFYKKAININQLSAFIDSLLKIPKAMEKCLKDSSKIKQLAQKYYHYNNFLYLGRGLNYPLALEGALKLKEISYIHAEAYSAGEMKHGPIALIDENMPVLVINTKSNQHEKTISNIQEVLARNGKVIALISEKDKVTPKYTKDIIEVPQINNYLDCLLSIIPLQLFAYYCAVLKGTDVDQPRNLAKSVTVE